MKKIITAFYQDLQTLSYSELQTLGRYLGINDNGKESLARAIAKIHSQRYSKANLPEGIDPNMQGFTAEQILEHLDLHSFIDADLSGADLRNAVLVDANLSYANLSNADMNDININNVILSYAILDHAKLPNAILNTVELDGADLIEADLTNSTLTDINMVEATLTGADMTDAKLINVDLSHADLSNAILVGVEFNNTNLTGAILIGADIRDADLTRANIEGTVFNESESNQVIQNPTNLVEEPELVTEEILQNLLTEYPTRRAIMDARRLGKITPNQFRALLERVDDETPVVEEFAEPEPVPQEARECTNEQDVFTLERWRADHLPEVKIRVPQAGKDYVLCIGYQDLITWLRDPAHKYLAWYPNSIRITQNRDMDPSGAGGLGYEGEPFYSLPGEYSMYVAGDLESIINLLSRVKMLRAQLLYSNKRIGSTFGISQLHGQAPGYPVYFLMPDLHQSSIHDLSDIKNYLRQVHRIKKGLIPLRLQQSNGYIKFGATHDISEWDNLSNEDKLEWERRAVNENLNNISEKFASLQNIIPFELQTRITATFQNIIADD